MITVHEFFDGAQQHNCSILYTNIYGRWPCNDADSASQAIFWQALDTTLSAPWPIPSSSNCSNAHKDLVPLLSQSLASTIPIVTNATHDAELPLDRFSLGADMIAWYGKSGNSTVVPAITALNDSLALQPENADGGLWYYDNPASLVAYQNLSYLDGMYSYPPFVVSRAGLEGSFTSPDSNLAMAVKQLQILYDICVRPSGLLVHGYDALSAHAWANKTTGASPEVWGRSLAWYSLGLLNTLEAAAAQYLQASDSYESLLSLFRDVMDAQIRAAEYSIAKTNKTGLWQVVDRPGEGDNFVEASSSFMTVYTLLHSVRLGYLPGGGAATCQGARNETTSIRSLAADMYNEVSQQYLIRYANGSLSLNGTSSIASLSAQDVNYEYYVTRSKEMDSLIGTSAFVLASHEMAYLDVE